MKAPWFHFTLGPVQSFVAQARRTRDFWAGSFLLSWLSGVAMCAVRVQGGEILFPRPEKVDLDWIVGAVSGESGPQHGTLPNRFLARVPEDFDAAAVTETVREAWLKLAELVWNRDLDTLSASSDNKHRHWHGQARAVWDSQHKGYWEIAWAFTERREHTNVLDRRKNWRSHFLPDEPGMKCMVMEGFQELSGFDGASDPENKGRRDFWKWVRETVPSGKTDLRDGEMLCALAYMKRRFARYFKDLDGEANGMHVKGWELPVSRPSVYDMAAAHWLERVIRDRPEAEKAKLRHAAKEMPKDSRRDVRIRCVREAAEAHRADHILSRLDASLYFHGVLDRLPDDFTNPAVKAQVQVHASGMKAALKALSSQPGAPSLSPYYAVLAMDGDGLGVQMSNAARQPGIALALARFAREAPGIVWTRNGEMVYVGGDDLLALLPLEDALRCARDLRIAWYEALAGRAALEQEPGEAPSWPTLSGAIVYAHVRTPLTQVLRTAHWTLEKTAKEECGRGAIAVQVLRPGGPGPAWAQPWEVALDRSGALIIEALAERFRLSGSEEGAANFSNHFLYRLRERVLTLRGHDGHTWADEEGIEHVEEALLRVVAADFLASGPARQAGVNTHAEAEAIIRPLLTQGRKHRRTPGFENPVHWMRTCFDPQTALLVRFLANKGVGDD